MKINNNEHARYDATTINQDYISGADVAVLVYDLTKPHTLEWCKTEASKLISWNVKKIIFAANKSDAESLIEFDQQDDWFEEHGILNLFVCATNNVGTEQLFIEMHRVDDYAGGSIYTLDCLQGIKSEYAREL